jgi:hypothetical protein
LVLIDADADNRGMGAFLIIAFLVLIGPLSLLLGVDSRAYDRRGHRRWL